jgi:hypothetical protein
MGKIGIDRPCAIKMQEEQEIQIIPWIDMYIMAFPVVEFSRQGYKIRKVFG